MKKIKVYTKQVIHQTWEYEVEVQDDFQLYAVPTEEQQRYLMDKIWNEGIDCRCLNDDDIREENVIDYANSSGLTFRAPSDTIHPW